MTLSELRDFTRNSVLRDAVVPQRFTDDEIDLHLNDAYRRFVRRTECLTAASPDVDPIETVIGTNAYALDERVIRVIDVYNSDGVPLRPANGPLAPWSDGKPAVWMFRSVGIANHLLLWPTPDDVYTYTLLVARYGQPMEADGDEPDIPETWHINLCDWAAHQCLRNADVIPEDTRVMGALLLAWERALTDAKRDVARSRHVNFMPALFARRG